MAITIKKQESGKFSDSQIKEMSEKYGEQLFIVRISSTSDKNEVKDVPVGVNGDMFLIQRDQDVLVPARVVEALRNAVETHYQISLDDKDQSTLQEKRANAYPFSATPV